MNTVRIIHAISGSRGRPTLPVRFEPVETSLPSSPASSVSRRRRDCAAQRTARQVSSSPPADQSAQSSYLSIRTAPQPLFGLWASLLQIEYPLAYPLFFFLSTRLSTRPPPRIRPPHTAITSMRERHQQVEVTRSVPCVRRSGGGCWGGSAWGRYAQAEDERCFDAEARQQMSLPVCGRDQMRCSTIELLVRKKK